MAIGADLIYGCLSTEQNYSGLLSLYTYAFGNAGAPCFTVRHTGNVGIFNYNPGYALTIGSSGTPKQVAVNGTIVLGSDSLLKRGIQKISSSSLGKLANLQGVSYQLKSESSKTSLSEKPKSIEVQSSLVSANPVPERNHYGFVAQDMREVFPELVYEDDSTGLLSIDYIGMIPLLLEGLKEQHSQIVEQKVHIEELREQLAVLKNSAVQTEVQREKAILYQNTPNPFNQATEIRFYIPTNVQSAIIYIYDIYGFQKNRYPIATRQEGSITIDGATLDAGTYFYTLVCDEMPIASKQMILTK